METTPTRFSLTGVSKRFLNVKALNDVSIDVRGGEVLALMGENGAGKSTLLRIMTGAYQADAGEIVLDGNPVKFFSPQDSRRAGVRVAAQEPDIVTGTTVAENLFLGELPKRKGLFVDRAKLHRNATKLLASFRFGRNINPNMPADRLSPAQRQMIEILRSLRGDLKILALDEPTSSLSESETEDLFSLINELRDRGVGIIYVSHRMKEVLKLADRVTVLRDGTLVGTKPARDLDEATLIRMMVGRPLSDVMRHERHGTEKEVLKVSALQSKQLHDISFTLRRGEVVGLAGLIGAGRTELAKTIFGELPHESGSITIDGVPCQVRRPKQAIKAGVAYVPEERKAEGLFLERSVLENASVVVLKKLSPMRFINRRRELEVVGRLVKRLRVKTPNLEQAIGKLSGGNQQKVILARWLAIAPKVLILDEPTRGIDVGAKAEIYALIEELAKDGMAVILISSELPELLGLADRILCMQGGRINGELSRENATEESVLSLCMAH